MSESSDTLTGDVYRTRLLRLPTFWERLRFGLSGDWRVIWTDHGLIPHPRLRASVREIEWEHLHTRESRRFQRGPTRFSRWRRVS